MRLAPAPDVHLLLLDDAGIVFDGVRRDVLALDTTGTVIWCLMEEGLDAAGMAERLRDLTGVATRDAGAFVDAAIADWAGRGLLAGSTRPAAPEPGAAGPAASLPAFPDPPPVFVRQRHYRLRQLRLTFRFTHATHESLVHPVLAHLEAMPGDNPLLIDVVAGPAGLTLYRDGIAQAGCATPQALAPLAKQMVWQAGLDAGDFLLDLHAGAVGGRDGLVLLPAPPGSGKSTLTMALMHAGFDYFSDEVALLGDDLTATPFPLALCVKDSGLDVAARMYPAVRALPVHARGDGKRVAYLPPEPARVPPHDLRRPVAAIVFPRFAPRACGQLQPLAKQAALAQLLSQCLGVAPALGIDHVRALVAWIRSIPCYELAFADLDAAVRVIGTAAGGLPTPR